MKREGKRKTRGKLLQNDKSPTESKDTSDGTSTDAEHEPMEAIQAKNHCRDQGGLLGR